MANASEKLIATEAFAAYLLRTIDSYERRETMPEPFSPSRYLALTAVYGGLGLGAAVVPSFGQVFSAFGGLVVLALALSAVPASSGQTLGGEAAGLFGSLTASPGTGSGGEGVSFPTVGGTTKAKATSKTAKPKPAFGQKGGPGFNQAGGGVPGAISAANRWLRQNVTARIGSWLSHL